MVKKSDRPSRPARGLVAGGNDLSGEHRLGVQLETNEVRRLVERERDGLSGIADRMQSLPPPGDRPSILSAEDATDMTEATRSFVAGVDQITDVLLLILARFRRTLVQQRIVVVLVVLMVVSTLYQLFQVNRLLVRVQFTEQQVADTQNKVQLLMAQTRRTAVSVEQVKRDTEMKPDIAIEPDAKSGGAKVVIRSPQGRSGVIDGSKSLPRAEGSSEASAPSPALEIPIELPPGARFQESP
jgi:hypothetical protein